MQLYVSLSLKHLEEAPGDGCAAGGMMWKMAGSEVRSIQKIPFGVPLLESFQPLGRLLGLLGAFEGCLKLFTF